LLQQLFGDRAPYPTDASRRAGDQNWICHVCFLLNAGRRSTVKLITTLMLT
jgi:hypothetical protein